MDSAVELQGPPPRPFPKPPPSPPGPPGPPSPPSPEPPAPWPASRQRERELHEGSLLGMEVGTHVGSDAHRGTAATLEL